IEPFSTYLVRFVSCVALHAIWSGSVGIMIYKCQAFFEGGMEWHEYIVPLFRGLGVAMILHGLYDTFLKKDMNAPALAGRGCHFPLGPPSVCGHGPPRR